MYVCMYVLYILLISSYIMGMAQATPDVNIILLLLSCYEIICVRCAVIVLFCRSGDARRDQARAVHRAELARASQGGSRLPGGGAQGFQGYGCHRSANHLEIIR